MAFPIIAAVSTLIDVVPAIARWIGGDKAGEVAEQIGGLARQVAGTDDVAAAAAAIKADPALAAKFQETMKEWELGRLQAENERLAIVNATYRQELATNDPYVRRMRPTFGYTVCVVMAVLTAVVVYAVVALGAAGAVQVIEALGKLDTMLAGGLAVLGVYVHGRSTEKAAAAGGPPGIVGAIARRIAPPPAR